MLSVGKANKLPSFNSLLMYSWHNSYYIGAAHGLSGIMALLMMVIAIYYISSLMYLYTVCNVCVHVLLL